MPTKADFFDELKDWSDRKIELITTYIDGAARILGSTGGAMVYVDGFAGRGTYLDGGIGSPVRIAELAQRCAREGWAFRLRCINVEYDYHYFLNLQKETAPFGDLVANLHGDFNAHVANIMQLIGTKPAVFFLDPLGVKDIPWHVVSQLVARDAATDIWIRLDEKLVRRIEGFHSSTTAEARGKYAGTLCDLYGIADPNELHRRLDAPTPELRIEQARVLYKEKLREEIGKKRGRVGYAGSYNIRSVMGEQHKYALVFGTADKKGIVLASDVVHNIEKDYQVDRIEVTHQPGLFDTEPRPPTKQALHRHKAANLADYIYREYQGTTVERLALHATLAHDRFGLFGQSHLTTALKMLVDRHQATMVIGPASSPDARFQIGRKGG